jgi:hypothetical protein
VPCESASNTTPMIAMAALAVVGLIGVVLYYSRRFKLESCLNTFRLSALKHINKG